MNSSSAHEVLIAGGGVAALEAVIALRDLAGDRVHVTLLAPDPDFVLKPLAVGTPFSMGGQVRHFPLADVARTHGAELRLDALRAVVPDSRTVLTAGGGELAYDSLVLAVGAQPYPAFAHALTFGTERDPFALNGVLADLEEGYVKTVAFVVAPGVNWPLPLYELALMTAREVRSMGIDDAQLTIVTPEAAPLAVFGPEASLSVGRLLEAAGIDIVAGAYAEPGPGGRIQITPGAREVDAQRVVALPLLAGPRVAGVPRDKDGFIPIDEHARVVGVDHIYAAGDGANFPIKQGGLATQQADAAVEHIAQRAGAPIEPQEFRPVLRGRLMTGGPEQFLQGAVAGGGGTSQASEQPLWWPPTKVSGRYLSPWLVASDPTMPSEPPSGPEAEVIVELPRDHQAATRAALALDPLSPLPRR